MLSQKEVQHVALLSRIGTTKEDEKRLEADLGSILDFFQELEGYVLDEDTSSLSGRIVKRGRADRVIMASEETRDSIRKSFPVQHHNYLKVRSVF